jgi:hypothetical protein
MARDVSINNKVLKIFSEAQVLGNKVEIAQLHNHFLI